MGFLKSIVDFIPNIINAGSQIHATNAAARTARYNTDQTNQMNKYYSDLAWTRDQAQIEKMNAYNTPAAQMQRFKDAGLNPNLIYGHGSSGQQAQLAKYNAPNAQYNYKAKDYTQVLTNYYSIERQKLFNDQVKANIEKTRQQTVNEGLKSALNSILQKKGLIDLDTYGARKSQEYQLMLNKGQLDLAQSQIMRYSAEYRKKQIDTFDQLLAAQLENLKQSAIRQGKQSNLLEKEISLYELGKIGQVAPGLTKLLMSVFGK